MVSPDRPQTPLCQLRSRKEPGSNSHMPSSRRTRCTKVTVCSQVPLNTTRPLNISTTWASTRKRIVDTVSNGSNAIIAGTNEIGLFNFSNFRTPTTKQISPRSRESSIETSPNPPLPQSPVNAEIKKAQETRMTHPLPFIIALLSSYATTPSIAFLTAPSIFPNIASNSASVHVTRMLKLMRRLSTASLLGNFRVLRSCGRPSSWATSL